MTTPTNFAGADAGVPTVGAQTLNAANGTGNSDSALSRPNAFAMVREWYQQHPNYHQCKCGNYTEGECRDCAEQVQQFAETSHD